jgi:hypothetical protein
MSENLSDHAELLSGTEEGLLPGAPDAVAPAAPVSEEQIVYMSEVSTETLFALRREHMLWCGGAGFILLCAFLLPAEPVWLQAVRLLSAALAAFIGLPRVWYLNGVSQELARREVEEGH